MATLPKPSRIEKLVAATADLTHDFALSYDFVADTIPRDTPDSLSGAWVFGEPESFEAGGAMLEPIEHDPTADLPIAEWIEAQASWYDQCEAEGSELIAAAIRRIRYAAEFHRCTTVAQILERSPQFRRVNLDRVEVPDERHESFLAEVFDTEARGYLLHKGDLARLVAWVLVDLGNEAEALAARGEREFLEARAEYEARCAEAADDDRE